ncbi:hypothetical protein PRUPE_5G053100 [Prunus persica]|uniref:Uncharacterized protein n=1 Tax=Prunus persica TaxID=3760 RepID=A0A251P450_PRUPE|nr:hypothetical protein PRUPE_5G053100 [Prunus persica]
MPYPLKRHHNNPHINASESDETNNLPKGNIGKMVSTYLPVSNLQLQYFQEKTYKLNFNRNNPHLNLKQDVNVQLPDI